MPRPTDGPAITRLIADCPPLDVNSAYCNLLQCAHFADTCVAAIEDGLLKGWISGYRPPSDPGQIFVWQVAVHPEARGRGLGARMLGELVSRPWVSDARALTATITAANAGSWALFAAFARRRGLKLTASLRFQADVHFQGSHDSEWEISIALSSACPQTKEP